MFIYSLGMANQKQILLNLDNKWSPFHIQILDQEDRGSKTLWSRLCCLKADGVIEHSADDFAHQFTNKMVRIRASTISTRTVHHQVSEPLTPFKPVKSDEVVKVLKAAPTKQ